MRTMDAMDGAAVRAWSAASVASLRELRADIDGINVYPVADSDTGSNLLHTVTAAHAALAGEPEVDGAGAALGTLAGAAVTAARGNSGVILSQVLRGFAESADGAAELDGAALAAAFRRADVAATGAVARPVAGTMLSVLHAVALRVAETDGGGNSDVATDLAAVATAAAEAAAEALRETPRQLAALAVAGVVDAGGRGLVAVLDALVGVVTGVTRSTGVTADADGHGHRHDSAEAAPRNWEVMYLLADVNADADAGEAALPELRRELSALGDSVTVAGDGAGNHAVHVHCSDIGAALEAGLRHGRPHRVRVEPLLTPPREESETSRATRGDRAVVVVVHGGGIARLLAEEGVPVLAVEAADTADAADEPTTEELLGLVTATAARHVTMLPGDVRLTAAAERVSGHAMLADRDVVVVPCASPVQVLSALAVHDRERRADADVVAMAEAAAATRRAELSVAEEDSITWVGQARAGDLVGFVDGEVVLLDADGRLVRAATALLERMLAVGGELVTVVTGRDVPGYGADVGERIAAYLRAEHPEVELTCYSGEQADTLLLMGVE